MATTSNELPIEYYSDATISTYNGYHAAVIVFSRIVPMTESLIVMLYRYCLVINVIDNPENYIFPSKLGNRPITKRSVEEWFEALLKKTGIYVRTKKRVRGPCLHCFRHLFAVNSFVQAAKRGHSVNDSVPFLSVYMGHENIWEAERYLKFSSEMFPELSEPFEAFTDGLFPEVSYPRFFCARGEPERIRQLQWRIRKDFSEGRPMNLPLLYGYKSMQGKIAVDDEEAAVVRRVFKEYLSGAGSPRIAARLREAAIPRRFGGTWTATAVIEMLSNEKYTGDSLLQKTYTEDHLSKKTKKNRGELDRYYAENTHPAIIDHETYERAQQIMARRREEINIRKPTGARYPLTGKIVCGRCGAHYNRRTRSTGRGSIPRYTWQCLTYLSRGKRFCPAKQIPEETLNALTCEALGVEELTEIAAETLEEILVIGENRLRFVFRDGRTEEKEWAWESRSGSWTPEMRRKASERMLRRWRHE